MTDYEMMDENERQQFAEFKRKLGIQAAQAQAAKIEYNLTDATVDKASLRRACQDANSLKLGGICVLPCFVKSGAAFLGFQRSTVLVSCVSFPHGGDSLKTKVAAVKNSFKDGADEAEVTAPLYLVKDGSWGLVKKEFKKLKKAAKNRLRINIESGLLTPQEITRICSVAADCGISSLRCSSGLYSGFNPDVLTVMKAAVKDRCTIKADCVATVTDMDTAVSMGAGIIGSRNAADLARLVLQTAEQY